MISDEGEGDEEVDEDDQATFERIMNGSKCVRFR